MEPISDNDFKHDVHFLKEFYEVVVLNSASGNSQIAIVPELQGRVMTSTTNGLRGRSQGWVNYKFIKSGHCSTIMNVYGGEDRFWLGPEGGQYALFFKPQSDFSADKWFTPPPINSEPFKLTNQTNHSVTLEKYLQIKNYQDYTFNLHLDRAISIFDNRQIEENLNIIVPNQVTSVGFQSNNTIKNVGSDKWNKNSGLLSIWILGMFTPSRKNTVIIPFKNDLTLNTSYFGPIEEKKLKIKDQTILFRADGANRCKLGLPPQNCLSVMGCFDPIKGVLTIVEFTLEEKQPYANSLWKIQNYPFEGYAINVYNDGPNEDGSKIGPFYELETSSYVKGLRQGETLNHIHKTYHFEGEIDNLNTISKSILQFDLNTLKHF